MRLVDLVIRGGHLSEQAIVAAVMSGERPAHLDQCGLCAERAVELSRWLDDVRVAGVTVADAAFPAERLAAQQAQILRRLEQLDEPARVIAFPSHARLRRETSGHRVAAGWLGVAAAAGLVLGVVGGQWTARISGHATAVQAVQAPAPAQTPTQPAAVEPAPDRAVPIDASLLDMDLDSLTVPATAIMDNITPRATQVALVSSRSGRK
ncbi:MAG TPA: hypothetical protein VLT86_04420 [Vicinamibacterales bacterium]|nr:hypothetical protein [Vicinamibacterales bacterium]